MKYKKIAFNGVRFDFLNIGRCEPHQGTSPIIFFLYVFVFFVLNKQTISYFL